MDSNVGCDCIGEGRSLHQQTRQRTKCVETPPESTRRRTQFPGIFSGSLSLKDAIALATILHLNRGRYPKLTRLNEMKLWRWQS